MDQTITLPKVEIWTEGKTDQIHLKSAMKELNISYPLSFHDCRKSMGDSELLDRCKKFSEKRNQYPLVFMFDRDNPKILAEITDKHHSYKHWGNNVYSFAIPLPKHRKDYKNLCIEFLYLDKDLKTLDESNRRIFLTSEFHPISGKLKNDPKISLGNKGSLAKYSKAINSKIIDTDVYNEENKNVALSKNDFAENINKKSPGFEAFNFEAFKPIFEIIADIIRTSSPKRNVFLPNFENLFKILENKPFEFQLASLFFLHKQVILLAFQIFAICTIREYEKLIVNDSIKDAKSIKEVLKGSFFRPTFNSFYRLFEKCFYLIDDNATKDLKEFKEDFKAVFIFDDMGRFLDDLIKVFPPRGAKNRQHGEPIYANKYKYKSNLFDFVKEFKKYGSKKFSEFELACKKSKTDFDLENWKKSLLMLVDRLECLFQLNLELRSINSKDLKSDAYTLDVKSYFNGDISVEKVVVNPEEAEIYNSTNYTRIIIENDIGDKKYVYTYPMMLVKEDAVYFYQKSGVNGYEYYSLANDRIHFVSTKKRFNHAMFKAGSSQEYFWTEVPPTVHPVTFIKANIPTEGIENFVGRKKQMRRIIEEIIEIPNHNGLIYGPGGIGKTALLQQLSKELFDGVYEELELSFENIIWITTKTDYYDTVFSSIEPKEKYSKSFDDILNAILEFFEWEDHEEYSFTDKQSLILEIFSENRVLLILDNFETILPKEKTEIIRFFGQDVSKYLKKNPDYFKVIITTREYMPSGFQPFPLKKLDLNESRQLMKQLYEHHNVETPFTKKQEEEIHNHTKGIPIVIKHCFGRMFEYNESRSQVLRDLSKHESNIVQFSYKEIINQIEQKDSSGKQLKILLLLDLLETSLTVVQMANILEVTVSDVENSLPPLINFQCIKREFFGNGEKFSINDEIVLLTKSLSRKFPSDVKKIKELVTKSSIEQEFDATIEEFTIAELFEKLLIEGNFLGAEDFIKAQLKNHRKSTLLNYHYSKYLIEKKELYTEAVTILERIRESSNNHIKVLSLLVECYLSADIPRYEAAHTLILKLEEYADKDKTLCIQVAEFYIKWSSAIKSKREFDPLDDQLRQQKYKSLTNKALDYLELLPQAKNDHRLYYLKSRCYYNLWENNLALKTIKKAISINPKPLYFNFLDQINFQKNRFKDW